jgi:hypothetical protein
MKRNSTSIFVESPNSITALPWVNNAPDFTGFEDPTLSVLVNAWNDFLASGQELEIIPDPEPVVTPDWDGLSNRVLGGDLFPLFIKLTLAGYQSIPISQARGDINAAVAYVRIEEALASGFQQIQANGFVFTEEEKKLWNIAVTELGFSKIVQIL